MIDDISKWMDQVVEALNKLNSLPSLALLLLLTLVFGYVLKHIKRFPNDGIPVAVIVFGSALNPVLSDFYGSTMPFRIWLVRNVAVGAIVSTCGWVGHRYVWKKIRERFPSATKDFETSPPIPLSDGSNVNPNFKPTIGGTEQPSKPSEKK